MGIGKYLPIRVQLLWKIFSKEEHIFTVKIFTEYIQNQNQRIRAHRYPVARASQSQVMNCMKDGALAPGFQMQRTALLS